MNALLRTFGQNSFVWKEVSFRNGQYECDGEQIREVSILAVIGNTEDNGFVKCSRCGAIIPNTPECIEAHKNRYLDETNCFSCPYLRMRTESRPVGSKYIKNKDGTYIDATRYVAICSQNYNYTGPIDDTEIRECCSLRTCKSAQFTTIDMFFTKYPNAFDDMITVDQLVEKGCTFERIEGNDAIFKLPNRSTQIFARTTNGIVKKFYIVHRDTKYDVFYSKKYDKLFRGFTTYIEGIQPIVAASTEARILKVISKLYE